jgi:hypothetical protein
VEEELGILFNGYVPSTGFEAENITRYSLKLPSFLHHMGD